MYLDVVLNGVDVALLDGVLLIDPAGGAIQGDAGHLGNPILGIVDGQEGFGGGGLLHDLLEDFVLIGLGDTQIVRVLAITTNQLRGGGELLMHSESSAYLGQVNIGLALVRVSMIGVFQQDRKSVV